MKRVSNVSNVSAQHGQKVSALERTGKKQKKYSRVPHEVVYDKRLSIEAKAVYPILSARVWQGDTCRIGVRLIASSLGIGRTKASDAVNELITHGHIKRLSSGRSRSIYVLTSEVFGQKQGKVDDVHTSADGKRKQRVSVRMSA